MQTRFFPFAYRLSLSILLLTSALSLSAHGATKSAPLMSPPPGDYQCYTWGETGSVKTPGGSKPIFGQTHSPLGTISLDGEGTYNNSTYKTSGHYNYSSRRGEVSFSSGRLARLHASAELGEQEYRLRFSTRKKTDARGAQSESDQVCVLRDPRFKANKQKAPDLLSGAEFIPSS